MPIVDESKQNKGVTSGGIGSLIDIYNNMNNRKYYPQTSSYHFRQFL